MPQFNLEKSKLEFLIFVPKGNKELKQMKKELKKRLDDVKVLVYKTDAEFLNDKSTRAHIKIEIQVRFSFRRAYKETFQLVMLKKD